jgi:thiol-disulfide isomerase/thioredoxin
MSGRESDDRPNWLRLGVWALFFGALAFWSGSNLQQCRPPSELVGTEAPPFEAPIVAGDGAGDRVSLEAERGHAVLLDFWASWCAPCRASIPIVTRVAQRHAAAGLVTYGVNVEADRTIAHVVRAHRSVGAGFPSLLDEGWRMQAAYEVETIPTLVLVDRRGRVRSYEIGVPDEGALDAEVREILSEPP